MRLTQKTITVELHRLGHEERLESGDGYFVLVQREMESWRFPMASRSTGAGDAEMLKMLDLDEAAGWVVTLNLTDNYW